MDGSFFNSQYQMIIYDLIFRLLDRYTDGSSQVESVVGTPKSDSSDKTSQVSGKFSDLIQKASQKYNVDPKLIQAVIKAESNFNPKAESSCGAMGLMQLMPGTAAGLGVDDPFNPEENVLGGTKLLSRLLKKYHKDISLALAAYNAGSGAVDKYGGIPPYTETKTYVKKVLGYLKSSNASNEWSG